MNCYRSKCFLPRTSVEPGVLNFHTPILRLLTNFLLNPVPPSIESDFVSFSPRSSLSLSISKDAAAEERRRWQVRAGKLGSQLAPRNSQHGTWSRRKRETPPVSIPMTICRLYRVLHQIYIRVESRNHETPHGSLHFNRDKKRVSSAEKLFPYCHSMSKLSYS